MPTDLLDGSVILRGLCLHGYVTKDSETGKIYNSLPERIPHVERDDTGLYTTVAGETLFDIAAIVYPRCRDIRTRAVVIGQFQLDPITDIGLPLEGNLKLEIPSEAFFQEIVYGPSLAESPRIL